MNMAQNMDEIASTSRWKRIFNYMVKHKWWIVSALCVVIILPLIFGETKSTESQFATIEITRGNLKQVVTATGEIKPVNTIKVGSQVSGNIENIMVDYNDKVKKGDVLLTIDPSVLQATADESKAALDSAQAQLKFDNSEYERNKSLFAEGYIARAELEQAETKYKTSQQSVLRAKSQYERAKTNLGYTKIVSPVDGTIISRKVDKGQTIAASFQAPDLFEIAEDLSKMQIETSVSEADIGVIKEKQKVTFTVDAYPTQTFDGAVRQIRLSPTTTSNVVVYTVVIDVDNSDLRLMPGMTAFVTIMVDERKDVWKVPNAAFVLRNFDGIVESAADKKPTQYLAIIREKTKKPQIIEYKKGLVTATETEIISDEIVKGDKIITGKLGQKSTATGGMMGGNNHGSRGGPGGPGM